jgi:O-antigen ligase
VSYGNDRIEFEAPNSTGNLPWSTISYPLIDESLKDYKFLDLAALLIPMTLVVEFNLVGRLYAIELLLLALLPITFLMRGRLILRKMPVIILCLGMVWFGGQVITDVIVDSTFHDYSRGWAKIAFTLLNFTSLYLLLADSRRRIILFAVGLGIGTAILFAVNPPSIGITQPWKFGLGSALVFVVCGFLNIRLVSRMKIIAPLAFFAIAAFFFSQGYRSGGGIAFMAAAYLVLSTITPNYRNFSPGRVIFLAVLGLIVVVGSLEGYEFAVKEGFLGADAQSRLERQKIGDYGVLLGGRSEILIASQAISDSPIIGHGSWAKDPYYSYLYAVLQFGDKVKDIPYMNNDLIPTHSVLFGAWVESGILGGFFWACILVIVFRVLLRLYASDDPLLPLFVFIGFLMIWDILFSPFGADRRFVLAYFMCLMALIYPALYSPYQVEENNEEDYYAADDEYEYDDYEEEEPPEPKGWGHLKRLR